MKGKLQCLGLVLLGVALLALLYVLPVHYVDRPALASDLGPARASTLLQPSTVATYFVTNGTSTLVISGTVYTVTAGLVEVDPSLIAYYQPLIDAGILVPYSGGGAVVSSGGNLTVTGNISANGTSYLGTLDVRGAGTVEGAFTANDDAYVGGDTVMAGSLNVTAGLTSQAAVVAKTTMEVDGVTTLGHVTASGPITLAGVRMTGPMTYGYISGAVQSGTVVAVGMPGITPTTCIVTEQGGNGTPITRSLQAMVATNLLTITTGPGVAGPGAFWMCGK